MDCDRTKKQGSSHTFLGNKSKERNMPIAERFLSGVVKIHGKHPLSTNGGNLPNGLQVSWIKTSSTFFFREKLSLKELCNT